MNRFQRYGNLLRSDGTNQSQRTLPALEPGYILPDERSLSDLLEYARKLAGEIRFYTLTGQPTGTWQPFLDALVDPAKKEKDLNYQIYDVQTLDKMLQSRGDWPPHLALFIIFLKLFQYLQTDLNELPQRHLRHYYENELNLLRREAAADSVHVIFELARNAASTLLPAQTLLDAGKDEQGLPRYYATQSDLVVSNAKINAIKRLVGETDQRGYRRFFISDAISKLEGESWYTFGRKQLALDTSQQFMQEVEIGFAIASPILFLAEGSRSITITASLGSINGEFPIPQGLNSALIVDLTGAKGWLTPDTFEARLIRISSTKPPSLQINLTLSETAPALVSWDTRLHGERLQSDWPVLRCRLNPAGGYYEMLKGLIPEEISLNVSAKGVKQLVVQNEQGSLTTDQPMPLFGSQPHLGSSFYIGSAEVFSKRLTSLTLNLQWQGLPDSLATHYDGYFESVDPDADAAFQATFGDSFTVNVDLLHERSWNHRILVSQSLFNESNPTGNQSIRADFSAFKSALGERKYVPLPELRELGPYKADTQHGFIRLSLSGPLIRTPRVQTGTFEAFGHQFFPIRYTTQAIALSQGRSVTLPNQPLTPLLTSLSLDYSASAMIATAAAQDEAEFFQLEPFGYHRASATVPARLVPDLDGAASTAETGEFVGGALYLGLTGLTPPGNVSLLFQIDQGTASSIPVLKQTATEWSYLSGDRWKPLPRSAILNDSTYGFQQPGLVVLALSQDASLEHTLMPTGMAWLRAQIWQNPESASRTLDLQSQSTRATFAPITNLSHYENHLQTGLDTNTIQRLKQRIAAIKTVSQPYRSFGGRTSETDQAYFRRCSERLRHRNRAVTSWDFERLVLEAFPEVFKVKCLPHSDANASDRAGEAALVIVPDLRSIESKNLLEPRASEVLMNQIRDYVNTGISSPFATVHVIHPIYERIRVDAHVTFLSGFDAGYYVSVLNEELRRFLSPWAYEEGRDIIFGSRIYKSEILAFMEGRNYVDYITNFQLYHIYDGQQRGGIGTLVIGKDFTIRADPRPTLSPTDSGMVIGNTFIVGQGVEVAATSYPHAILVSHPEHRITVVNSGEEQCSGVKQIGIGYMTVGLDFNVLTVN